MLPKLTRNWDTSIRRTNTERERASHMFQVDGTIPRLVPTAHDAASGNTVLNPGPCLRSAEMIKKNK